MTSSEPRYEVLWSADDEQWVAVCDFFPSLSYLADSPSEALDGLLVLILEAKLDMAKNSETPPLQALNAPDQKSASHAVARSLLKRDSDGAALTSRYRDRIETLRRQLSAWHFAKETLTKSEHQMLYVAEQLMATLDDLCGGYIN